MQNLEKISAAAKTLPESVKNNALELIDRMSAKIEGIGDEDITWRPPFLRLVQGTTDRTSIPKGTAIGDIVLGEKKLDTPYPFIPLRIWDARTYWDPDQTSKRILCSSPDAKVGTYGVECRNCPYGKWKEDGPSACGKTKNMLAISADLSEVFTMTFAKSGYKVGVEFQSMLNKVGVAPYARVYQLSSETSKSAKNVEVFKVEALPADKRRTPEEMLPFLTELFASISADRKESLSNFYTLLEERKAAGLLGNNAPQALSAPASDADSSLPAADESEAEADGEVKAYSI